MSEPNRWINRRKYQLAQGMILKGAWVADLEAGTIYSKHCRALLAQKPGHDGYHRVAVWDSEMQRNHTALVSRILWEHRHGEIPDDLEVNHKNGDKSNNGAANLELLTQPENIRHAHETGLCQDVLRSPLELEIAAALETGMTHAEAAKRFGVGKGTVHRVRARRPDYVAPVFDANRTNKACPRCRQDKPIDQYSVSRGRFDGRSTYCRPCVAARHAEKVQRRLLREGPPAA